MTKRYEKPKELSGTAKFASVFLATILLGLFFNYLVFGESNINISLRTNTELETGLSLYYTFDNTSIATSTIRDLSPNAYLAISLKTSTTTYATAATSTYVVPLGANFVRATALGAGGGGSFCFPSEVIGGDCSGGDGGSGGYAQADLAVTPGESLIIETGSAGTYNFGGGASTVKRGLTYLLIAGGGGGGGGAEGQFGGPYSGGAGGSGGGTNGNPGQGGTVAEGGGGGTTVAGGTGGTAGAGTVGSNGIANAGGNGSSGGGVSCGSGGVGCGGSGFPGGGGGGGRFGGGGGQGNSGAGSGAGGGGGGSGLLTGTRTSATVGGGAAGGLGDSYILCADPACTQVQFTTVGEPGSVHIMAATIGTTTTVAGRLGQGVKFNGADDAVQIATSSGMTLVRNTAEASAAFWVKIDDFVTGVPQTVFAISRGTTDLTPRFQVQITGTTTTTGVVRIAARAGDSESIQFATTTTAVLTEGQWHHVVAVVNYASDTFTLYVDGAAKSLNATPSFTATASSNTPPISAELGRRDAVYGDASLGGVLDDVRFYSRALSANEASRMYHLGATTQENVSLQTNQNIGTGLTNYWTFDGAQMQQNVGNIGSGGTVGRLVGFAATTTVPGRMAQGLSFDGTNDYVTVGNAGSGIRTIAFWMKADDISTRKILNIDGTDQVELNASAQVTATSFPGTTVVYVDGSSASTNVSTSTWHHVVITDTTGVNASSFEIGRVSTSYYDGDIDDVRLYTGVLAAADIQRLYHLGATTQFNVPVSSNPDLSSTGLLGHWTFDGPRLQQNVTDSGSGGNVGRLINFVSTTTAPGRIGQALDFDGTNDYITMGDVAAVDSATALTGCAWIYPDSMVGDRAILAKMNGITDGFILDSEMSSAAQSRANAFTINIRDSADTDNVSIESAAFSHATSTWSHVCFTFTAGSATGLRLYINGVEDANSPANATNVGAINAGANPLVVGMRSDGTSNPFNGKIDDVRLYTRALSASEIKKLYQLGAPRSSLSPPFAYGDRLPLLSDFFRQAQESIVLATEEQKIITARYGRAYERISLRPIFEQLAAHVARSVNASLQLGSVTSVRKDTDSRAVNHNIVAGAHRKRLGVKSTSNSNPTSGI